METESEMQNCSKSVDLGSILRRHTFEEGGEGGIGHRERATLNKILSGPQPSAESPGAGDVLPCPKLRQAGQAFGSPGQPLIGCGLCSER